MLKADEIRYLVNNRFFWFELRCFFPEYSRKELKSIEYPFDKERSHRSCEVNEILGKRPSWDTLNTFLWVIEKRETAILNRKHELGSIEDEQRSILEEVIKEMKGNIT